MAAEEELRIKVTADTSKAKKDLEEVADKVEETGESADESKSKWQSLADKFSAISPTFKSASEKFQKSGQGVNDAFGGMLSSSKLMKLGVIGALAAIAVKAAKVAWQVANETASMFDPTGYQEAASEMQRSIKKLKTAVGSFTAPIVEGIMKAISKIVDGITWLVEKIRVAVSFISGVYTAVYAPIIDAIKSAIQWLQDGINTISNFLGFGDVFKASADSASETADEMGEIVDATSAGLAGFDKLNTLDVSNGGDTEEADKISEEMAKAKQSGMDLVELIKKKLGDIDLGGLWDGFVDTLKGIPGKIWEALGGLSDWLGEQWAGFTDTMGGLYGKFCEAMGGIANWLGEQWGKFVSKAQEVWNKVVEFGTAAWNQILGFATLVWSGIVVVATTVWNTIVSVATTVWNAVLSVATAVWNAVYGVASAIWGTISSVATTVWTGIQDFATTVWGIISEPILTVWNTFRSTGEKCWSKLQEIGEAFNRIVIDPIKSAVDWCMDKIQKVLDMISSAKSAISNLTSGVSNAIGSVTGGIKSALGLASGGAVAPNNPSTYILGDNKKEYEVVSPVSLMKDTVKAAIAEMGGTGGSSQTSPVELTINLDGKKMARAIYEPLRTETRRRGGTSA